MIKAIKNLGVRFFLQQAMKARTGSTDIDYFYTSLPSAARKGAVWSTIRPSRFTPERIPDTN